MKTVCLLALLATSALMAGCDDGTKPVTPVSTGTTAPAAPVAPAPGAKEVTTPPVNIPKTKLLN